MLLVWEIELRENVVFYDNSIFGILCCFSVFLVNFIYKSYL